MLTEENKKDILESFLETIEWISNKEYQKRVWIKGEGPEVNDFCETCCFFFPAARDIIEKYKEYDLTETQYIFLKEFSDRFEIFSDEHYWEVEFIDSPEWHRITEMAKEVLKAFDYKKNF